MMPNGPPSPSAVVRARDGTACSGCGVTFDARAWSLLELVERVALERVRAHVTHWPRETSIEVRQCPCGRRLARTSLAAK